MRPLWAPRSWTRAAGLASPLAKGLTVDSLWPPATPIGSLGRQLQRNFPTISRSPEGIAGIK